MGMGTFMGQGQGQGYGIQPGMSARSDNIRVPNRPRSEMEMNEGSEAAANAFASMLGVASQSSLAPQSPQGQASPPASYMNPSFNQQGPYAAQAPAPYGNGTGALGGGGQMGQMGQNMGPYNTMINTNNTPPRPQSQVPQPVQQEKPQKRGGLFEAIRNFFFRQS
jgi:hypothetical protein